jgi:hypothetical protein
VTKDLESKILETTLNKHLASFERAKFQDTSLNWV